MGFCQPSGYFFAFDNILVTRSNTTMLIASKAIWANRMTTSMSNPAKIHNLQTKNNFCSASIREDRL